MLVGSPEKELREVQLRTGDPSYRTCDGCTRKKFGCKRNCAGYAYRQERCNAMRDEFLKHKAKLLAETEEKKG